MNWSFIYYEQGEYKKAIEVLEQGLGEIPNEPDFLYRIAVYHIEDGHFKEEFNFLENALLLDFEGHRMLFDFFPKPETQKALFKIIDQFRKENQ